MYAVKRKAYQEEKLRLAINSVNKGDRNVTQAASHFEVPRQSLADKVRGKLIFTAIYFMAYFQWQAGQHNFTANFEWQESRQSLTRK